MAKNFSKFLGKVALMTAAALWAGCNDSDKKADEPADGSKIIHPWDVTKFYDKKHIEKDEGNINDNLTGTLYGCNGCDRVVVIKSNGSVNIPSEEIVFAKGSVLGKDSVVKIVRMRTPGIRHLYNRYLRKKADAFFSGKIVFSLEIGSDGSVVKSVIDSSTTGVNDFDEEIKSAIGNWVFPKSEKGKSFITFPVYFYEHGSAPSDVDKTVELTKIMEAVAEKPRARKALFADSLSSVKEEFVRVRALYGVVERDFGNAVTLYGVRPVDDGFIKGPEKKAVARCLVEDLKPEDIVIEDGSDVDLETVLKIARQRLPSFRHICNKNLYTNVKYRAKRTKEFKAKIVLTLKIAPDGSVENVEIKSTTIGEKSNFRTINEDVRNSVGRWKFPKTQNGGTVTIPISLYEKFPEASSSGSEQPLSSANDH